MHRRRARHAHAVDADGVLPPDSPTGPQRHSVGASNGDSDGVSDNPAADPAHAGWKRGRAVPSHRVR